MISIRRLWLAGLIYCESQVLNRFSSFMVVILLGYEPLNRL
jgi:hypothetical protein